MAAGMRFTVEKPVVAIRSQPSLAADSVSQVERGDEIVASDVFIEQGIEWVRLSAGATATRSEEGDEMPRQVFLNLEEDGFVPTQSPHMGLLLRKHQAIVVEEEMQEGVLTKAEIQEILERSADPGILLPLESKYWSRRQLELFVMSGGAIRPKWCSLPDERLMANVNMSPDEVMQALAQAADWISHADALLIGSGAGMGVDSGLGTFRGGQKGVWAGLEAVGLAYEEICMPKWFKDEPHLGWAFWNHCHAAYQATVPHEGYTILREWGERCPLGFYSFTSNIDSHWIVSGTPAEHVLEVHGAVRWLQCSQPCSANVWKAPKDLGLVEDVATHRVQGVLPTCPKCGAVARPNVQMFGSDEGFSKARRASQFSKYDAWLKALEARPDKAQLRVTCLEVGCGLTVPTVRRELEEVVRKFPGARIIRVNPENPGLPPEIAEQGVSLPMRAGVAIREIGKQVATDADYVTFILWGEGGGVELLAPYGTCLGRLLRLAQKEEGMQVDFTQDTVALTTWLAVECLAKQGLPRQDAVSLAANWVKEVKGFEKDKWATGDVVKQNMAAPAHAFAEVKVAEGSDMRLTAVLYVGAKFSNPATGGLNAALATRTRQALMLLDETNTHFKQDSYQEALRKCTDYRSAVKLASTVHNKLLPRYGFEASERGSAQMRAFLDVLKVRPDVGRQIIQSMELNRLSLFGEFEAPTQEEQTQEVPQSQPLEVVVSTLPSQEGPAADRLRFSLTDQTTVAELRRQLQKKLRWDDEGAQATRFMINLGGTSFAGLKDDDLVKREVFLHGGPGLRPPEKLEVTFTEMALDDEKLKGVSFSHNVMTDTSVTQLRQKLGDVLGWDPQEQKRAKFLVRFATGSLGTMKEHEKVGQRKAIFVAGASLRPRPRQMQLAVQPGKEQKEQPNEAPSAPAAKEARQQDVVAKGPKQESVLAVAQGTGKLVTVSLIVLGTQDSAEPDSMRLFLPEDSRVAELRKILAEELKLGVGAASGIKFISRETGIFNTMMSSDRIKEEEHIFVRGVATLQPQQVVPLAKPTKKQQPPEKPKPSPMYDHQMQMAQVVPQAFFKPPVRTITVTVLVDHSRNIRVPLTVPSGSAIATVKDMLCANDFSGRVVPDAFNLRPEGNDDRPALPDHHILTEDASLEVMVLGFLGQVPKKQAEAAPQARAPPPQPETLQVSVTRLTTLEDARPQRLQLTCKPSTKVSEVRSELAKACGLDAPAARRMKLLFRSPGGSMVAAKDAGPVSKEMFIHNIDKWPE